MAGHLVFLSGTFGEPPSIDLMSSLAILRTIYDER
jgi:hypothetical protein